MTTYFKPKQIVILNEAEEGIWKLINKNNVWCEREYKAKDTQHVFLSSENFTKEVPTDKLAIVQASSLNNLFENDLIGTYKVCEGYYKFFNKLMAENEDEKNKLKPR